MKLLLCSGPDKPAGFVTLDANPKHNPDWCFVLPCRLPLFGFNNSQWEEIHLIHGIEHFYLWEAGDILKECYRALQPGGKLVLEQPNIFVAAMVLTGEREPFTSTADQSDMWPLYGDPTHKDPLFCHKWGYTPETLRRLLTTVASWSKIETLQAQSHIPDRDFRMEAVK